MNARLELFLQGGLGNQLIQLAYADSLHVRTGAKMRINPVLLHPIWSRLRSISRRERCWNWASRFPEVSGLPRQSFGLMRLYHSRLSSGPLTDHLSDEELLQRINDSRTDAWHGLLGYFQRHQAFESPAQDFWSRFKRKIQLCYHLVPFPLGQVVAHVRLGDYLWPENQRLFARYSLNQQILDAQRWSSMLGGSKTIHLVTDDPVNLQRLLEGLPSASFTIYRGTNAVDDFLFLARHRHIVGSNSTFSLCAGRLAFELWRECHTLTIPSNWYVNDCLNKEIQGELLRCSFIRSTDQLLYS